MNAGAVNVDEEPAKKTSVGDLPADQDSRVLELYKLAVEMADRVSARRATANAFFLTAQTALVAVIALATPSLVKASWWISLAVSLAGVTLSASWWLQLKSYRDLNSAKFEVINGIEEDLPVKVFSDEWAALKAAGEEAGAQTGEEADAEPGAKRKRRYMELGTTERLIPAIFALLYVLLFLGRVIR